MINFDRMKSLVSILFVPILILLAAVGCKKHSGGTVTGGGKGGHETIRASAEHYGTLLDTATIYIKYGTLDEPADGVYDDSMVCVVVNDTPVAVFSGLTTGNYFFMAKGLHRSLCPYITIGSNHLTAATEKTDWLPVTTQCQY